MTETEMRNFIMVWSIATTLFWYSYIIGKVIPKGKGRLIALFPPILIFLLLPLRLTSMHLGLISSFFLAWLSTFKLILYAFAKGPLSSNPPPSLPHFLLLASLPIKFQQKDHINQNQNNINIAPENWRELVVMAIISYICIPLYGQKENLHPFILLSLHGLHFYTGLELFLSLITTIVRKLIQIDLEQPFDKPYLSTSVQDFWGRRWNIMVSRILHPTIYEPMLKTFTHVIGRKWAPLPAVVVTFTVSGLMHELIFYYMKQKTATWEAWEPCWDSMFFFLIHGVGVALQIGHAKIFKPKQLLPRVVSWMLTMIFIVSTSVCLFLPALARCGVTST
ncbi:unnamed protein product [Lathyrus sativus]|nr:unnamed protein product [Lathyrus sativus]